MPDGIEVKLQNGDDLIRSLRAFREDVAVKTVRASIRRIGKNLRDRASQEAPQRTGKLRRNIRQSVKYVRSRGVVVAKILVNTVGKASDAKNAFYWRFVEFGHRTRPRKGGVSSGQVPPNPFAQRAFASIQSAIKQTFFSDLERAVRRAGNKRSSY